MKLVIYYSTVCHCILYWRRLVATPAHAMGSASPRLSLVKPACITFDLVRYMVLPSPRSAEVSYWGMTTLITLHIAPFEPGTRQIFVHTAPSSVSSTVLPWW